ncbi:putative pentatricopeptide repeat-containing protein At1g10330 [Wolffia australiana]
MWLSLDAWARLVFAYRSSPRPLNRVHALLITAGFFLPRTLLPFPLPPQDRTVLIFNILIASSAREDGSGGAAAIRLFAQMLSQPARPNAHTFPALVKSLAPLPGRAGVAVHAQLVRRGLVGDNYISSAMVKLYARLGDVSATVKVFDENPCPDLATHNAILDSLCKNGEIAAGKRLFYALVAPDVVTWTTLIDGLLANGFPDEALRTFATMVACPNEATLVCALSACANCRAATAVLLGKQLHCHVLRRGASLSAFLGTALVDMYGKRGLLCSAREVFRRIPERRVCAWNAMIMALACNGEEAEAMVMFREITVAPNSVTLVAVLTACARGGMVAAGLTLFEAMDRDFGVVPRMEHCGCVVDMLGRAGRLDEAAEVIAAMPFPADASVWGALLGACRLHGNAAMAAVVAVPLLGLQSGHGGRYAALLGAYADEGMWASAARVKAEMERGIVKKTAGCSWLESHPGNAAAISITALESRPVTQQFCGALLTRRRVCEGKQQWTASRHCRGVEDSDKPPSSSSGSTRTIVMCKERE